MGGVGDEVSLGVEGGFKAGVQVVEDVAKFGQLVGRLAEVEVTGGDGLGGGGDGPQGPEEAAGDKPAGRESKGDEDRDRDGGGDKELVRADPVTGSGDRGWGRAVGLSRRLDAGERDGDRGEDHDPDDEDGRGIEEREPDLQGPSGERLGVSHRVARSGSRLRGWSRSRVGRRVWLAAGAWCA